MNHSLEKLFKRDLKKLSEEIIKFNNEENLWQVTDGISNSAGNLTLHICGNLNHYIGAVLGRTNYTREREKEFKTRGVPRCQLINDIEETSRTVAGVMQGLSNYNLKNTYPVSLWDEAFSTEFFLVHLHSHLNYHLGQINYLRRVLEK